jgi:hypothetical protein
MPILEFQPILSLANFFPTSFPFFDGISVMNSTVFFYFPIPRFLVKGIPANTFFIIGISLSLIGITYRFLTPTLGKTKSTILMFGDFSFSLIFLQSLLSTILFRTLNGIIVLPITIIYMALLAFLVNYWWRYRYMSIDWIFEKIS